MFLNWLSLVQSFMPVALSYHERKIRPLNLIHDQKIPYDKSRVKNPTIFKKHMTFWFLHNTKKSGQVWWGWGQKHCNRSRIANLAVFAAVSTSKPTRSQWRIKLLRAEPCTYFSFSLTLFNTQKTIVRNWFDLLAISLLIMGFMAFWIYG